MTAADRDARARKVARLYGSGLSVRQAAAKAGIHHQTALDDLRRLDDGFGYGPGPWRRRLDKRHAAAKGKRTAQAVQLRTQGLSLRTIAAELGVSHQTVANDLARWDAGHPNVISLSKSGVSNLPPRGENLTPEIDSPNPNVVPLARKPSRNGGKSRPAGGKMPRQKLTTEVTPS